MAQQPPVGQGLPIIEASQSHSDTPHSVGLLWTSDQPDAETHTLAKHNTHRIQTSMLPQVFEHTIPGSERPQTHTLDSAATGIGFLVGSLYEIQSKPFTLPTSQIIFR